MNKVWLVPDDKTRMRDIIGRNINSETIQFAQSQVDLRFVDDDTYKLLDAGYSLPAPAELTVHLDLEVEGLPATDMVPVGLTLIARPFRLVT